MPAPCAEQITRARKRANEGGREAEGVRGREGEGEGVKGGRESGSRVARPVPLPGSNRSQAPSQAARGAAGS